MCGVFFFKKFFSSKKRCSWGFSLLELCITLIVVGGISMMFMTAMRSYYNLYYIQQTKSHQQIIFQALTQHFLLHGCLPCPEYPEAMPPSQEDILVGIVPFRQLGLSEKTAQDGFHHWMTYAVDKNMTVMVKGSRYIMCDYVFSSKSSLQLKNKGKIVMKTSAGDGIAFLLVSHGKTGWGSFYKGKNRYMPEKNISWSQSKKRNANDKNRFSVAPPSGEDGCFDDDVVWMTKGQLLVSAGILCADYLVPTENMDPSFPSYKSDKKII